MSACPDCSAKSGDLHLNGCDVERCPDCGDQFISCGCENLTMPRLPWTGEYPGAMECREFGWYAKYVQGKGWQRTNKDNPQAVIDLNRLARCARWSKEQGRYIKKQKDIMNADEIIRRDISDKKNYKVKKQGEVEIYTFHYKRYKCKLEFRVCGFLGWYSISCKLQNIIVCYALEYECIYCYESHWEALCEFLLKGYFDREKILAIIEYIKASHNILGDKFIITNQNDTRIQAIIS